MNQIQENILKVVKASFDADPYMCIDNDKVAKHFNIELYEVIYHLQELSKHGYVTIEDVTSLSDLNGDNWVITGITPKGRMAIKELG